MANEAVKNTQGRDQNANVWCKFWRFPADYEPRQLPPIKVQLRPFFIRPPPKLGGNGKYKRFTMEVNPIVNALKSMSERTSVLRGYL